MAESFGAARNDRRSLRALGFGAAAPFRRCGPATRSHAVPRGQRIGQLEVPLVHAGADVEVLDLVEQTGQLGLIGVAQRAIGHREQTLILLLDVLAQQEAVVPGARSEGG